MLILIYHKPLTKAAIGRQNTTQASDLWNDYSTYMHAGLTSSGHLMTCLTCVLTVIESTIYMLA